MNHVHKPRKTLLILISLLFLFQHQLQRTQRTGWTKKLRQELVSAMATIHRNAATAAR